MVSTRVWLVVLSAIFIAGGLIFGWPQQAISAAAAAEKPMVYNHITTEGSSMDALAHRIYDPDYKVVDFRDKDGVYIPPVLKSGFPPLDPKDSNGAPIKGKVVAFFIVAATGHIEKPVIVQTTDERLKKAVLDALNDWIFQPGRVNGKDVSTIGGEEFEIPQAP